MADKRSNTRDEEEEYFHQEDQRKKEKLRRQQQLKALRQQERSQIAEELSTSEAVADEALALGFDGATARVLPLLPLIQVAWADGTVTTKESEKVFKKAAAFGITPDSAAHEFLSLLLEEQPTDLYFERANQVMARMVEDDKTGMSDNVLAWSKAVAEASGGFFGLANPISKEERAVLDELATVFGVK